MSDVLPAKNSVGEKSTEDNISKNVLYVPLFISENQVGLKLKQPYCLSQHIVQSVTGQSNLAKAKRELIGKFGRIRKYLRGFVSKLKKGFVPIN